MKRDKIDFCVSSLGEWRGGCPIHRLEGLEEGLLFGSVESVSYKETNGPPDPLRLEGELGLKFIFGEARNLGRGSISPSIECSQQGPARIHL